jgi:sugar phosphate isomerase/epimerase
MIKKIKKSIDTSNNECNNLIKECKHSNMYAWNCKGEREKMYGVSPAWFLSKYGEDFTCSQAAGSLQELKGLGFGCWQPEIFKAERLEEWENGGLGILKQKGEDLGLKPSQFVAHFLLHAFDSPASLDSDWGISQCEQLMTILCKWTEIPVITVPVPAFAVPDHFEAAEYEKWYEKFVLKIWKIAGLIEKSGRVCGLEVLPGALIGGSEGIVRLQMTEGLKNLCTNLDTGHFNASGEKLGMTLNRIGRSISGTHLCDNDGVVNLSLEPGAGSIDWKVFKQWTQSGTYNGSWDIEIRCHKDEVDDRYRRGLAFMKGLLGD